MRRRILRPAILAFALVATAVVSAGSQTSLSGVVAGASSANRRSAGRRFFFALFAGAIDDRPAIGLALGGIVHEPLPQQQGECVNILDGRWSIRTLQRTSRAMSPAARYVM